MKYFRNFILFALILSLLAFEKYFGSHASAILLGFYVGFVSLGSFAASYHLFKSEKDRSWFDVLDSYWRNKHLPAVLDWILYPVLIVALVYCGHWILASLWLYTFLVDATARIHSEKYIDFKDQLQQKYKDLDAEEIGKIK